MDAAPQPPPSVDAAARPSAPDPATRLAQEEGDLPLPSGDVVWGISVPTGCTANEAYESWIGFACRPSVDVLGRYYRFRFPALRVEPDGEALVVRPDDARGYARLQRVLRGGSRARLIIFRDRFPGDDEGARRLRDRLRPADAPARSGRSETSP